MTEEEKIQEVQPESRAFSILVGVSFCLFLGIVLVLHLLLPDRSISAQENRALQTMPALSVERVLSGAFMSEFADYANDQFPGRDGWIALKAYNERLTGRQENNGIYFADEGTLIARFEQPERALLRQNLSYVEQFANSSDVPVYFSLIPNAVFTWKDRLPYGAPNADQYAVMNLASESKHYYSTNLILQEHKDEELYYRTDHHWTTLGAYYGYVALMQALDFTPQELESWTPVEINNSFTGTLAAKSSAVWIAPDSITTYVAEEYEGQLYDPDALETRDKYSFFLGGNAAERVVVTQQEDKPKLLLLRDSHADSMVPFLIAHCSEIHLIDLRYYKQSIHDYIAEHEIDAVVILYGVSNFTSDENLFILSLARSGT